MPAEGKRLFVISPYPVYPVADGAGRRIDGMNRLLGGKGFEVFLFAPRPQKSDTRTALPGRVIRWIPYERKRTHHYFVNNDLSRILKKHLAEKPDLIILHFPYLCGVVYPLARKHNIPVHLDAHNVEHQRFRNMGRPFVAALIYLVERHAVKNAKSVSVTSKRDAATLEKKFGRTCAVIENFIDTERFFPLDNNDRDRLRKSLGIDFTKIICYFGNFTNISTKQAYRIISEKIAPRLLLKDPQIKIVIIGRGLKKVESAANNLVIVGEVDRIEPYIQVSDMVIVPLVSGGGTRYKILEALGCGIPVLSTPKGNEGLDLDEEDGVILADVDVFPERIAAFFEGESSPAAFRPNRDKILNKYSLAGISRHLDWQKTFGLTGIKTS
jgi:glycosyltransferase involved in cell wall biosynthesis